MPRATYSYPFEAMVYAFTCDLAERLVASGGQATFLLMFNNEGRIIPVNCTPPTMGWHEQCKTLQSTGTPYIFYDPFDAPEHTWLSWFNVSQTMMERIIKQNFASEHFVRSSHPARPCSGELQGSGFPQSWGVMF
jgi:hypothetical protein